MKLESDVKADMVRDIKLSGGYARRIEDQYAVGFPDLIIVPIGRLPLFAEVKRVQDWVFAPSPRQFIELERIRKASCYPAAVMIGYKDGVHCAALFNPGVKNYDFRKCFQQNNETVARFIERFYDAYVKR